MNKNDIFPVLIELKRKYIKALTPESMKNHDGKSYNGAEKLEVKLNNHREPDKIKNEREGSRNGKNSILSEV